MVVKALLIGINYISIPTSTLRGCINDIHNMKNMLVSAYNVLPSNIVMLSDDPSGNIHDLPTYDNIIASLTTIVADSSSCQEIWIHYSGHGSQVITFDPDDKDGMKDIIVPLDYLTKGFITGDMIYNIIKGIQSKAIIIMDSCSSETVCELEWTFENNNGVLTKIQNNKNNIENPNIFMFSGCKDSQKSFDMYDISSKQYVGVMTDAFLDCLKNKQYSGSILNLYLDICAFILKEGYSQQPCFSSSYYAPLYYFINPNTIPVTTIPTPTKLYIPSPLSASPSKRIPITANKNIIPTLKTGKYESKNVNMKMMGRVVKNTKIAMQISYL